MKTWTCEVCEEPQEENSERYTINEGTDVYTICKKCFIDKNNRQAILYVTEDPLIILNKEIKELREEVEYIKRNMVYNNDEGENN